MKRRISKFSGYLFVPFVFLGILLFINTVNASLIDESFDHVCERHGVGDTKWCDTDFYISGDHQFWSYEIEAQAHGHGATSEVRVTTCAIEGGSYVDCITKVDYGYPFDDGVWRVFADHGWGTGDWQADFKGVHVEFYVKDAELNAGCTYQGCIGHITGHGRKLSDVWIDASPNTVIVGDPFSVDWGSSEGHYNDPNHIFSYGGAPISCDIPNGGSIDNSGSTTCTAEGLGVAQVRVDITGPSGSGPITIAATDEITINPLPPPSVNMKCNDIDGPCVIDYNTSATLKWIVAGAASCTASGDWSGSRDPNGGPESTGNLTSNKTYRLTCDNGYGDTAYDEVTVQTSLPPPGGFSLTGQDCAGDKSFRYMDMSWSGSSNADYYEIFERQWTTGAWVSRGTTTGASFRWDNPRLGTDFYWQIDAVNNTGRTGSNVEGPFTCEVPEADIRCFGNDSCTIGWNDKAELEWCGSNSHTCADANSCSVSGGSDSWSGTSGKVNTSNLKQDTLYTLTCSGQFTDSSDNLTVDVSSPPLPEADIRCNNTNGPCTINWDQTSQIEWCGPAHQPCKDADSCSVTRNGAAWKTGLSGDFNENPGPGTWDYQNICIGPGGTNGDVVRLIVNPPVPTTSNVSATMPNYCATGPSATIDWDYSDPSGSPQDAYQVQIDNNSNFSSPEVDSCPGGPPNGTCASGNTSDSYFSGTGILQFNNTYYARVRTWNTYENAPPSSWTNASSCNGTGCNANSSWTTPVHAYPNVGIVSPEYRFTWDPTNPAANSPIQFTDKAWFDPSSNNKQWSWTFVPAGGGSGSSTVQNPVYTFNSEAVYQVTESVRDNALSSGQYCTGPTQAVNIQKPIPIWKEIAPR